MSARLTATVVLVALAGLPSIARSDGTSVYMGHGGISTRPRNASSSPTAAKTQLKTRSATRPVNVFVDSLKRERSRASPKVRRQIGSNRIPTRIEMTPADRPSKSRGGMRLVNFPRRYSVLRIDDRFVTHHAEPSLVPFLVSHRASGGPHRRHIQHPARP